MTFDEPAARAALRAVEDPEAGMNIVDLGLVYAIAVTPQSVKVEMTMTSPACPMGAYLVDEVEAALRAAAPPGMPVRVELVWEPPWSPERMSPEARRHFGWTP
jgi:metal-sulfur cluster biosynthetic enzyme